MDKDHTTIIHYLKTFEWLMSHDKTTKRRYTLVSDAFYNPIRDMKEAREQELLNEINLLQEQVKSLSLWKEKYFSDVNLFKRYKDFITELDSSHEKEFLVQKFTKAVRNFS
jgi:archaellum component FlaC